MFPLLSQPLETGEGVGSPQRARRFAQRGAEGNAQPLGGRPSSGAAACGDLGASVKSESPHVVSYNLWSIPFGGTISDCHGLG